MGYLEQSLSTGEQVLYQTRLHWIVMFWHLLLGVLAAAVGIALFVAANQQGDLNSRPMQISGLAIFVVGTIIVVIGVVRRSSIEMAVTNKRVLVKVGVISRRTIEIMLGKIESVRVDQSLAGRMLRFGTIVVRGVGGTPEPFANISNPLEFRRQVQEQIDRLAEEK